MPKILIVNDCMGCGNMDDNTGRCFHPKFKGAGRKVKSGTLHLIPDWCPLEDEDDLLIKMVKVGNRIGSYPIKHDKPTIRHTFKVER